MSPLNKEYVLEAKDISISYGKEEVVKHISFAVGYGEAVAIVGASGSGKSTVLHSILGLLPDNGKVTQGEWIFRGTPLSRMSIEERRALRGSQMAMLFQHPGNYLNPTMKIKTQYRDFLLAHGCHQKAWKKRAEDSLARAGFMDVMQVMESIPSELSGGMRQKVAAAMTLEFSPALLMVDEPTAALDSVATWDLLQKLKKHVDGNHSLLIVTHDMHAASYLADRILVMHDGEIVATGSPEEMKNASEESYARQLLEAVPELR